MSKHATKHHSNSEHSANGYPFVISDAQPAGEVTVPVRSIGDTSAEEPVVYPKQWPAAIAAVMKKRGDKPVRLYADGIFDIFHYGHARALEQAKKSFPNTYLMVGCCNDELTHKYKGLTVMDEKERYESLRHCKWVDEVIPDAPWVITDEFLEKHDIDFVCHDALPYADTSGSAAGGDVYAHLRTIGKFHETKRTEGVSTSDLIIRIVKRYDDFVRRNLSRGYSGKDMNVPFWKEKSIQIEMAIEKQTERAKTNIGKFQDEFVKLFRRDGPVVSSIVEGFHRFKDDFLSQISPPRHPKDASTSEEDVAVAIEEPRASGAKRKRGDSTDSSTAKRKRSGSSASGE